MASGDSLLEWDGLGFKPAASSSAVPGLRNSVPTFDFNTTTDSYGNLHGVLPRQYAGGGLTLTIKGFAAAGVTTGTVLITAAFEREGTDIDTDSFATAVSSSATTVNGTSGISFNITITMTNAQLDGLLAGEGFRLQLMRDISEDTAAGDFQCWAVEMRET